MTRLGKWVLGLSAITGVAATAEHLAPVAFERWLGASRLGVRVDVGACRQSWTAMVCEDVEVVRGRDRLHGSRVRVRVENGGLHVEIAEPSWSKLPPAPVRPAATVQPATPAAPETTPRARPPASSSLPIPITVVLEDPLSWPVHDDLALQLHDVTLRLSPEQPLEARGHATLTRGEHRLGMLRDLVARPDDASRSRWSATGQWEAGQHAGVVAMRWDGTQAKVTAREDSGGTLELIATPRDAAAAIRVRAKDFRANVLPTFVHESATRYGIDLSRLLVSGNFAVEREDGLGIVARDVRLSSLVIRNPKVSVEPVVADMLALDARMQWHGRTRFAGAATLMHRGASVALEVKRTPARIEARATLPETECQALFDALPKGLRGITAAMQLQGRTRATAAIDVPLPVEYDLDRPEQFAGELELEFPFLADCSVTADPPEIDLHGLRERFVHRFVDGVGRQQTRVFAPGAPGYVRLAELDHVANAFVTMEDAKFWTHDGFDRTQMERAFWHDLSEGGFARGASTITQQTARILWLGIDRTFARKLQEALLATRLEQTLSKRRILEIYLNLIELAPGIHGVEEASRFHFGKPAAKLRPLQAVHLAAMAPAPARLSARFASGTVDPAWLDGLREQVRRMRIHGYLTRAEERKAIVEPLRLRRRQ